MTTSNNNTDRDPRLTSSQPEIPAWTRAIGMTKEARDFGGFTLPPLPQGASRTNRNNPPTNTSSIPTDQNASTSMSSNTTNTTNTNNSTTNTNSPPAVKPNPADNRENNMDTNTTTNYNNILSNMHYIIQE